MSESASASRREQARAFWDRYDIPFAHDTIKVRRSGLLRGGTGDGHAADTVVHLHVREAFRDGRLSRDADTYLCEPGSVVAPEGREERYVEDGDRYRPRVTCETCLNRLSRWRVSDA